jgi:hypothetical protein
VLGLPFERRALYIERSPLYHVDKLRVPLLVHVAISLTTPTWTSSQSVGRTGPELAILTQEHAGPFQVCFRARVIWAQLRGSLEMGDGWLVLAAAHEQHGKVVVGFEVTWARRHRLLQVTDGLL